MPKEDWRSRAAYEYAEQLDSAGLAWEFLRRNPEYRASYETRGQSDAGAEDVARRWGLNCPG